MNRKQLMILVVVGVIVGAIGLITYRQSSQSWEASGPEERESVFPEFAPDKVAEVHIQSGTNQLSLVKGDQWTVKERDNYPADFSKISELVTSVWELEPVRQVEIGDAQLDELNLLPPDDDGNTGTLVTFSDTEGNELQSFLLGKEKTKERSSSSRFGGGSMPVGRYVRASGEDAKVFLVEETFSSVDVDPSAWLDTTFFSIDNIRSVAMEGSEDYQWEVSRETVNGEWTLASPKEGETLATNKVSSLGSVFSSPSFNDVLIEANAPAETGLNEPKVATINTFDDFTYRIQIGKKTSDNEYPLTMEVSADLPPVPEVPETAESGSEDQADGEGDSSDEKLAAAKKRRKEIQGLHDKLEQETAYQKWTYLVPSYTVNSILKKRSELMVQPDDGETEGADSSGAGQSTQGLPPTPGSGGDSLVPSNIPGVDSSEGDSQAQESGQGSSQEEEQGASQGSDEGSAAEGDQDSAPSEGEPSSSEEGDQGASEGGAESAGEGDQATGDEEAAESSDEKGETGVNDPSDSSSDEASGDSGRSDESEGGPESESDDQNDSESR